MFTAKKESLFSVEKKKTVLNEFINSGLKESAKTKSGNNAEKFLTTGNPFVDQFGKMGSYKEPRSFDKISRDMSELWAIDPLISIKFALFMRTITRKVSLFDGALTSTVQRGSGLKHESIMRFMWIYTKDKDLFYSNLNLFVSVGAWKDVIDMMRLDLTYHGWDDKILDFDFLSTFVLSGLENPNTSELIKKYLPQLKAKSKCITVRAQANTIIAKYLASKAGITYKEYRQLKASGEAHSWQKLISNKLFDQIDFNKVHGRALTQLVSSKFLANHKLEDVYDAWIESQPIAKFTGYPHEIFEKFSKDEWGYSRFNSSVLKKYQISTINKQFDGLIELGKTNANTKSGLIVVRDTSGSMGSTADGSKMSAGDIAKALALYFSEFLTGEFKGHWIEFADRAKIHQWKGSTIVEKWDNDRSNYIGGTDFQSVISLFCSLKSQGVNESDFPSGILCISDGEFNPGDLGKTNVESAILKLKSAGFSKEYTDNFQIVLWNLRNNYYGNRNQSKFETYDEAKNVFYFSGYDASIMAFLTGTDKNTGEEAVAPKTDVELFNAAMDQEILNMIAI